MAVNLKTLLPAFVSQLKGIRELLDAAAAETARLERAAEDEHRQFAVSTAGRGLEAWERELALFPRPDLDEVSRRALALAALSFFSPCTPQSLTALYAKMTGGEAAYSETPSENRIELSTVTPGRIVPDLPGIFQAVSRAAPAHIFCLLSAEGGLEAEKTPCHALHASVSMDIYTEN